MNKEVVLALIAKDVAEFQSLLPAVSAVESLPEQYLRLLVDKAQAILSNTNSLAPDYVPEQNQQQLIYQAMREIVDDYLKHKNDEKELLMAQIADLKNSNSALAAQILSSNKGNDEQLKQQIEQLTERCNLLMEQTNGDTQKIYELTQNLAQANEKLEAAYNTIAQLEERINELQNIVNEDDNEEENQAGAEENNLPVGGESGQINREEPREEAEPVEEQVVETQSHSDAVIPEAAVTTVGDTIAHSKTVFDTIHDKPTLAQQMNNQKIEDLRGAISIADRFRFMRELFANNGEEYNRALEYFNSISTIEQAQAYIDKNYQWSDELKTVAEFKELLRRRYL